MLTRLLSVSDRVKKGKNRRAGPLRCLQAITEARGQAAVGILLRAIRKSLITLNQDIPAFPLFVYRTQNTVVVIVKRPAASVERQHGRESRPNITYLKYK